MNGLERFPSHKGLVKNFELLVKSNPGIASSPREGRQGHPGRHAQLQEQGAPRPGNGQCRRSEGGADFIDSPRTRRVPSLSRSRVEEPARTDPSPGAQVKDKPPSPSLSNIDRGRPQPLQRLPCARRQQRLQATRRRGRNYGNFFAVNEDAEAGVYADEEERTRTRTRKKTKTLMRSSHPK